MVVRLRCGDKEEYLFLEYGNIHLPTVEEVFKLQNAKLNGIDYPTSAEGFTYAFFHDGDTVIVTGDPAAGTGMQMVSPLQDLEWIHAPIYIFNSPSRTHFLASCQPHSELPAPHHPCIYSSLWPAPSELSHDPDQYMECVLAPTPFICWRRGRCSGGWRHRWRCWRQAR